MTLWILLGCIWFLIINFVWGTCIISKHADERNEVSKVIDLDAICIECGLTFGSHCASDDTCPEHEGKMDYRIGRHYKESGLKYEVKEGTSSEDALSRLMGKLDKFKTDLKVYHRKYWEKHQTRVLLSTLTRYLSQPILPPHQRLQARAILRELERRTRTNHGLE